MAGVKGAPATLMRALFWPGFFTSIGAAALVALGVWQLHRLAWKEALIAEVAARASAPPVAPPEEADWPSLRPAEYEYRRVSVAGTYDFANEAFVFRALENPRGRYGGPGYFVLTPLSLANGATIIVNRGFIPEEDRNAFSEDSRQAPRLVSVRGLMRASEPRNWFTPADDPARGQWFTRDPTAIAAALKLERVAPFTIDADASADRDALPEGGETILAFPNNHLSYALTWFAIALALVGVFVAFVLQKRQEMAEHRL